MKSFDLAIVILSYNVKELLIGCLKSVFEAKGRGDKWQVIVVDNASTDGSAEAVAATYPQVEVIKSKKNVGFSAGNNLARKRVKAETVLFLNPDTKIIGKAISKNLTFLKSQADAGAVTCRVELPDGNLDYSCHRGFPTPVNALAYFSGLSALFPHSKLLSGYKATYLDLKSTHEIDCITGAFLMIRKKVLDKVGWWDSDYFWNGEDIELCWQIKQAGWKIYYRPTEKIVHFKGSSSGLWKTGKMDVPKEVRERSAKAGIAAMRIFYRKHFGKNLWANAAMWLLERVRLWKLTLDV